MTRGAPIGGGRAAVVLARVALHRLLRSRTLWIVGALALVPVAVAALDSGAHATWHSAYRLLIIFMVVVPPLLVAAAVSEEIEDRTYTYLWSRPLPRWSMVAGKLLVGWPVGAAILSTAAVVCYQLKVGQATDLEPDSLARALAGCAIGVLGTSLVSAGWAALTPALAQRLAYAYLFVDLIVGELPFALQELSITHHIRQLAGISEPGDTPVLDAVWCVAIGAAWLAIGLVRLRRAEYKADR